MKDNPENMEDVLIAHTTEIAQDDRELISRFLSRLGLTSRFVDYESFAESARQLTRVLRFTEVEISPETPYRIADIKRPDDLVVREHIEDFEKIYPNDLPKGFAARVFNTFVDGIAQQRSKSYGYPPRERRNIDGKWLWRPVNPYNNIQIFTREEADLPPYHRNFSVYGRNNLCASYAVPAGAIVASVKPLRAKTELMETEKGLILVANQVESQFED